MRILAVSHLFPHVGEPRYGIFVARQLQAMTHHGADITLVVPRARRPRWLASITGKASHQGHESALEEYEGIDTLSVPYFALPGYWYNNHVGSVATKKILPLVSGMHEEKPFDVIYGTNLFLGGDVAVRLGRKLNIPATCLAIGTDVNRVPQVSRGLEQTYSRIVRELDGLLACGDGLAEKLDQLRSDKSLSVYGVVDLDLFSPANDKAALRKELDLPVDRQLVTYVGYLVRPKGLLELIAAFERVHAANDRAELVLYGHGNDEKLIREVAANSSCPSAIRFMGAVPPDTVHRYLQASDLFVLPSHNEGMPNVVMEAMACGIPVVATSVGGLPAALGGCEGAVLVPPRVVAPLAEGINAILGSPDRLKSMGVAARAKAESSFGAKPNAKRIVDYLAGVISGHNQVGQTNVGDKLVGKAGR